MAETGLADGQQLLLEGFVEDRKRGGLARCGHDHGLHHIARQVRRKKPA